MSEIGSAAVHHIRKSTRFRIVVRGVEYILLGLIILAGAGAIYQSLATAGDVRKYTPPGAMVNVGVYQLHLYCSGEDGPTVVMEAGRANWSAFWSLVQPRVARFTRVCSYDRAGLGWSDPGPRPRTAQQMVDELHTLLRRAHLEGPYVLVGHSAGGYTVRLFASQFPEEVSGVTLLDTSIEEGTSFLSPEDHRRLRGQFNFARMVSPLGLLRLMGNPGLSSEFETLLCKFPADVRAATRAMYYPTQTWETSWDEIQSDEESRKQVRAAHPLADKPLVALTAVGEIEDESVKLNWFARQAELAARLSPRGAQVLAEQSGHFIQLDQPELVVDAIGQVVQAVPEQ